MSCFSRRLLTPISQENPQLGTLIQLLNAPTVEEIC
jgi:hypothetical protein